jgi:U32 family peptidase
MWHGVAQMKTDPDSAVHLPELLSPAGDWDAMRAAVVNGADAVYFGLSNFNARFRAANFSLEDLPNVMRFLHEHNVRGYVAFNTLIFSEELEEAAEFVRAIASAGADAVIVQDLGLAELIGKICPTLAVHGSTQMTLTEPLGIEFVRKLGVQRAILARELSKDDIGRIAAETDLPLEVFVHGALCVAYSGQCLTSESLGGRSANRGQCAQACRLPYDLIVDGDRRDLGQMKYLLSPQDLAAMDCVGDLAGLGISCIKIEGRLKSADYVAAATQTYRAAVDALADGAKPTVQQRNDLAQIFSRGFTHGFLDGVNHQELVHARYSASRGLRAGRVTAATHDGLVVKLERDLELRPGDGVVLEEGRARDQEQGGRIFAVRPGSQRGTVEICFRRGDLNCREVEPGCTIWKTDDPLVRRRLEQSYRRDRVARPARLDVDVSVAEGATLSIAISDELGRRAVVGWDRRLERAETFAMTREIFIRQFGRLGGTPFCLGEVKVNGGTGMEFPAVMIPTSVLNDLRRRAVTDLMRLRTQESAHAIRDGDALVSMREATAAIVPPSQCVAPQLHVLARSMEQLQAIADFSPIHGLSRPTAYCEFEDVRKYPDAVRLARQAGVEIALVTVRIIKPTERGLLRAVAAAKPDAVLVRNLAGLCCLKAEFPELPLIGDYSLNVANELTAAIFAREGMARLTPSYDLTWQQLSRMLERFSPAWFEMVIHQQMPMFHMEHCVFAHALSNGKDYHDCGRPCESHRVDLRDRAGAGHPLIADVGCRNTVYNATPQSAAEFVPRMLALGIRHFRIELLRQTAPETRQLLEQYAGVLAGVDQGRATFRRLGVLNQLGVTRGTLE